MFWSKSECASPRRKRKTFTAVHCAGPLRLQAIAGVQVWLAVGHLELVGRRPVAQELREPDAFCNVESRVRPPTRNVHLLEH